MFKNLLQRDGGTRINILVKPPNVVAHQKFSKASLNFLGMNSAHSSKDVLLLTAELPLWNRFQNWFRQAAHSYFRTWYEQFRISNMTPFPVLAKRTAPLRPLTRKANWNKVETMPFTILHFENARSKQQMAEIFWVVRNLPTFLSSFQKNGGKM